MQIRGSVVHARKAFVKTHFGPDAWNRVAEKLPEESRKVVQGLMVSAGWYPFKVGEDLDKAIVEVLGKGDEKIFEDIGIQSAKENLTKDHKSFLSPGNPHGFMSLANTIYQFYYDTGRRTYEKTGDTSGIMTTYDAETFSVPDCLTVIGWYKEALRMCGARNVQMVEETCRARGGDCCRYRVQWDM